LKNATPEYQIEFLMTEESILKLAHSLPPIYPTSASVYGNHVMESLTTELGMLHEAAQGGMLQLHLPFTEEDVDSREKALNAAKRIVMVGSILEKTNEIYWHVSLHVSPLSLLFCSGSGLNLFEFCA
jgi:hypothetical protein